jgi:phospholipase/carboxylesterase
MGKQAQQQLLSMGYQAEFRSYPMEHAVCPQEVADISRWLQRVLSV